MKKIIQAITKVFAKKEEPKASPIWCDRDAFQLPLYYCLAVNAEEYQSVVDTMEVPTCDAGPWLKSWHAHATTHFFENRNLGKVCAVVCLDITKATDWAQMAGLIVHEATHIWQEVRHILGEKNPSTEFEAYTLQTITQNLFEAAETKYKMFNPEKPNASAT